MNASESLIPAPHVANDFHITRRTLSRWMGNEEVKFPKPTVINRRLYFKKSDIDAWKASRFAAVAAAA